MDILLSSVRRYTFYSEKARFLFRVTILTWIFLLALSYAQKEMPIILGAGFREDSVIVLVDGDTLFNDVVSSSLVSGFAREVLLPKKNMVISFIINKYKALTVEVDPKTLKRHSMIVVNAFSVKKFPAICYLSIEIVSYKTRFFN